MLTIPSLLAAMTIAGAFWVGVLAARRLRDWGDGRRVLEEGDAPLALSAASGAPTDDASAQRVRSLVADRLATGLSRGGLPGATGPDRSDVDFENLRIGDVVSVDTPQSRLDGDYLVEGVIRMREGSTTTVVAVVADGSTQRWLVGGDERNEHMIVQPVDGHALVGEPPRNVQRQQRLYALDRRGQSSAASVGKHGRPEGTRVGTYVYKSGPQDVLWLERWGNEVLMGEGQAVAAHGVTFLPGT
jgi:hypothetical protein